jgi:6-phosphogluconate dehydrogenase
MSIICCVLKLLDSEKKGVGHPSAAALFFYFMTFLLHIVMITDGADVSAETMTKKISKADLIYVDGGNTFYLQRHIIESSFWNIANPFLEKGPCVL